jgi:predicted RecA/RadA family phage recombinase
MKNQVQDGKVVTLVASVLVHPTHSDGLVNGGDHVVVGSLVGVAVEDAAASTDNIDVVRQGVFNLSVIATDSGGNSAVAIGDKLFIDSAANAAITKNNTKTEFGIAMAAVNAGATATIPVLVTGF